MSVLRFLDLSGLEQIKKIFSLFSPIDGIAVFSRFLISKGSRDQKMTSGEEVSLFYLRLKVL